MPNAAISLHADAASQPNGSLPTIEDLWMRLRAPSADTVARVAKIRSLVRAGREANKSAIRAVKTKLPAVTISGSFTAKGEDGFVAHSGFYVYDFDHMEDAAGMLDALAASALGCLAGAFMSPSGDGVKVVLQGPETSREGHRAAWKVGLRLIRVAVPYEPTVEDAAEEVSRLCFLSDCREPGSIVVRDWFEPFVVERAAGAGSEAQPVAVGEDGQVLADIPDRIAVAGGLTRAEVEDRLGAISADCGYHEWVRLILAIAQTLGKTDEAKAVAEAWSQTRAKGAWDRTERRTFDTLWKNAEIRGDGVDYRYIDREARKAGWRDWYADLRRKTNKDGEVTIVACEYNIGLIIDWHPQLRGRVWYDEITGRALLAPKTGAVLPGGAIVEENVAWNLVEWLQAKWAVKVCAADGMLSALFAKAKTNSRNKRREWLLSLTWDGVERLGDLFVEGFGSPDTPLNRAVATTWMVGAAARTLRPGTDFQLVPILQGPQGKGKSLGIAALCPEREWVVDSQVDMTSKSGYEVVRTATIVELAELSSMSRAEAEAVKAFVSHRSITYRAAYDKQSHSLPVSWVFVGTTNEHEVLKDRTGNRRYVPIAAPGRAGGYAATVAWIEANREQLWAEAVARARKTHGSVVLPEAHWAAARQVAEDATVRDVAEDGVEELSLAAAKGDTMALTDIMAQLPGVSIASRADQLTVGAYLRKYGWERATVRQGPRVRKMWRKAR